MALIGTQQDLADAIGAAITAKAGGNKISMSIVESDGAGGTVNKTYALGGGEGVCSAQTLPNPLTGAGISVSNVTGVEALAAVIADKVLDHIIENFELAAQARMDQLEMDYNNFLANLQIAAAAGLAVPFTAGLAAGMQAAIIAGQGPARAGITAGLKAKEKAKAKGGELY
jgi:hypothetical protein